MTQAVHELLNLGPKSAAALAEVGIDTAERLLNADAFEIYRALKAATPSTSMNFLYALIGAQQGIHWQEVKQTRRGEILLRLDDMGLAPK